MTRTDPQLKVRLPPDVRDRVQRSAQEDRRSMNSQIIVLLERALPAEETKTATEPANSVAE